MIMISNFLILATAVLHIYFLALEMFLWTKPIGLKAFRQTLENAQKTKVLAANQGLYNGFLAAGLTWGIVYPDTQVAQHIKIFFLSCVIIAGIFGAFSVSKKIFFIQAVPALMSLLLVITQN